MNGDPAKDQIQYIMLTRPVKDCTLWVHTEPLGWPGEQKLLTYEDCDDGQTHTRELMQHAKLVTLTAQYEHTLLHLQRGEAFGFQLAPRDDQLLCTDWWNIHVRLIRRQVLDYYLYGTGQDRLRSTIIEKFVKSVGGNLATTLSLLPASPLVTVSLQDAKRARSRQEVGTTAAMAPPSLGRWAWPVDFRGALSCVGFDNLCNQVWALGARTVDCVTIRPSGEHYAVTAVPLLEPFPGVPEIPYSLNRGTMTTNEPADAIMALVMLTWALWWAVHHDDVDYNPVQIVTVHHKATLIEAAGLEWWTRGCSCDRAALCLISEKDADKMCEAAANRLQRPKKPRAPRLYAYLGGGVDHQPDQVSSIVIRTRDRELLVAAVAAARLAMATWPSGTVAATFSEDLVDGDAESAKLLARDFQLYNAYNPPAVGEPARRIVHQTFEAIMQGAPQLQPMPPPKDAQRLVQETIAVDQAAEDPPASALHRHSLPMTESEPFEPDWSTPWDEPAAAPPVTTAPSTATRSSASSSRAPATATPSTATTPKARPTTATPAATPATERQPNVVRFGVDLGGVLWPFMHGELTIQRALSSGPLPWARDWMASLVRRIGAENVFIVSKVGHHGERT